MTLSQETRDLWRLRQIAAQKVDVVTSVSNTATKHQAMEQLLAEEQEILERLNP